MYLKSNYIALTYTVTFLNLRAPSSLGEEISSAVGKGPLFLFSENTCKHRTRQLVLKTSGCKFKKVRTLNSFIYIKKTVHLNAITSPQRVLLKRYRVPNEACLLRNSDKTCSFPAPSKRNPMVSSSYAYIYQTTLMHLYIWF